MAVGWAFVHDDPGPVYVIAPHRRHANLAELYVNPQVRGHGYGRALIEACEDWARARGHTLMTVGVLTKNERAIRSYEGAGFAPYMSVMRRFL